jgi:hypothetical protein
MVENFLGRGRKIFGSGRKIFGSRSKNFWVKVEKFFVEVALHGASLHIKVALHPYKSGASWRFMTLHGASWRFTPYKSGASP